MLAHRPPYRVRAPIRPPIGYGSPILPAEVLWQSIWPYRISLILGSLIMLFAVVIFALEIALIAIASSYGAVWYGVYGTGVGIWTGFFIFIAGVFILILKWVKPVRLWALIALCLTSVATVFAIINFSINASRVQLASAAGLYSLTNTPVGNSAGLVAAQLAIGIVIFLLCLAFIGVYIFITIKVSRRMSYKQQQISHPVQRS